MRSNVHTREINSSDFDDLFTLLEMAPPVLDHLWTQDSSICPLTYEHKMESYIVQGRSITRDCVSFFGGKKRTYSRQ